MEVVSPTELFFYTVQIQNCFLIYNSELFFPLLFIKSDLFSHGEDMTCTFKDYMYYTMHCIQYRTGILSEYRNIAFHSVLWCCHGMATKK